MRKTTIEETANPTPTGEIRWTTSGNPESIVIYGRMDQGFIDKYNNSKKELLIIRERFSTNNDGTIYAIKVAPSNHGYNIKQRDVPNTNKITFNIKPDEICIWINDSLISLQLLTLLSRGTATRQGNEIVIFR